MGLKSGKHIWASGAAAVPGLRSSYCSQPVGHSTLPTRLPSVPTQPPYTISTPSQHVLLCTSSIMLHDQREDPTALLLLSTWCDLYISRFSLLVEHQLVQQVMSRRSTHEPTLTPTPTLFCVVRMTTFHSKYHCATLGQVIPGGSFICSRRASLQHQCINNSNLSALMDRLCATRGRKTRQQSAIC